MGSIDEKIYNHLIKEDQARFRIGELERKVGNPDGWATKRQCKLIGGRLTEEKTEEVISVGGWCSPKLGAGEGTSGWTNRES